MSSKSFDPAAAQRILDELAPPNVPFFAHAARRARVPVRTAEWWLTAGSTEYADPADPQTIWALEVERIRAEWVAEAMLKIASANKDTRDQANQLSWLLTRLDRTTFDTSRPPTSPPKGETNDPKVKRKRDAATLAAELASSDDSDLQ